MNITVAPRVGAWIETQDTHPQSARGQRRSPRGSGYLNLSVLYRLIAPVVAPRVGAWIETRSTPVQGEI